MPRSNSTNRYTCAVATCQGPYHEGVSFHRFPKTDELREAWLTCCQRGDSFNMENSKVCSRHFPPQDIARDLKNELLGLPIRKRLVPGAIPSENLEPMSKEERRREQEQDEAEKRGANVRHSPEYIVVEGDVHDSDSHPKLQAAPASKLRKKKVRRKAQTDTHSHSPTHTCVHQSTEPTVPVVPTVAPTPKFEIGSQTFSMPLVDAATQTHERISTTLELRERVIFLEKKVREQHRTIAKLKKQAEKEQFVNIVFE